MKTNRVIIIITAVATLILLYRASQGVVKVFSGIGASIPYDLAEGSGYLNHLRGTLSANRSYTLEQLNQRYYEETEFKVRYVETLQNVLKKLRGD